MASKIVRLSGLLEDAGMAGAFQVDVELTDVGTATTTTETTTTSTSTTTTTTPEPTTTTTTTTPAPTTTTTPEPTSTTTVTTTTPVIPPGTGTPPPTPVETIDFGHGDVVPDFGAHPTLTAVQSGNWSDVNTWGGRLPQIEDSVLIPPGISVTLDTELAIAGILSVLSGGEFIIAQNVTTKLRVGTLFGKPGSKFTGNLLSGKSNIQFLDFPFDAADVNQFGHGMLWSGTIETSAPQRTSFVRLASEVAVGVTTLSLASPVSGWQAGDKIFLPDSRSIARGPLPNDPEYRNHAEFLVVAGVSADGLVVTLATPTLHAHPGARDKDGVLRFLPHVANTTRSLKFLSENSSGVRGHIQFIGHAHVLVSDAEFLNLGRSTVEFFGPGNQKGRYPFHMHHLHHEVQCHRNAVYSSFYNDRHRGGIVIHSSSFGEVADNVVVYVGGCGIATEGGDERDTDILRNFVSTVTGFRDYLMVPYERDGNKDAWWEGYGIWLRGYGCRLEGNVVADCLGGIIYYPNGLPTSMQWPKATGGTETINPYAVNPIFRNNEVYGGKVTEAMTIWSLGWCIQGPGGNLPIPGMTRSYIEDYKAWNLIGKGYYNYTTSQITFLRPTLLHGVVGFFSSDYHANDFQIVDANVQGFYQGYIFHPYDDVLIHGGEWRNQNNFWIPVRYSGGPPSDFDVSSTLTLRNVRSYLWKKWDDLPNYHVYAEYSLGSFRTYLMALQRVVVEDWQGIDSDDFRVYRYQQVASFVPPASITDYLIASPDPGKTNSELLASHGVCVSGEIAPLDAVSRTGIYGLVKPIS